MDEAVNPLELSHEKHENWSRDMVLIAGSFQQKSGRHVTCSKAWKRKTRWHHVDVQWVQSKPCVPSALLSFLSTRPAVWSAAANCSVTALYARAAVPGRPQPLTGAQHLWAAQSEGSVEKFLEVPGSHPEVAMKPTSTHQQTKVIEHIRIITLGRYLSPQPHQRSPSWSNHTGRWY